MFHYFGREQHIVLKCGLECHLINELCNLEEFVIITVILGTGFLHLYVNYWPFESCKLIVESFIINMTYGSGQMIQEIN